LDEHGKIYWHEAFFEVLQLELYQYKDIGDGIYHIVGDIVPIQVLESKQLSSDSNLFLHNLRSNLSAEDMLYTLQSYKERKPVDDKNVYLDRLIRANIVAFKEATKMSEAVKEIFLKTAEENGWLDDKLEQEKIKMAQKMLIRGYSVEEVAEIMELSLEVVKSLL